MTLESLDCFRCLKAHVVVAAFVLFVAQELCRHALVLLQIYSEASFVMRELLCQFVAYQVWLEWRQMDY